ncbi:MAG: hypothetical protein JO189_29105 [Deltaproteobacteria bacterium]|nr:hypothetical protein [Deltaproteobacteria bacterium]
MRNESWIELISFGGLLENGDGRHFGLLLRPGATPSMPTPAAPRCAASGIDRVAAAEHWALVPSTLWSVVQLSGAW